MGPSNLHISLCSHHLSSRPDRVTGEVIGGSGARKATPHRFGRSLNESSVTVASAISYVCTLNLLLSPVT